MATPPKLHDWVRVPQLKGRHMCALCGRRAMNPERDPHGCVIGYQRWCAEMDKSCRKSALRCAGPFVREDKVKKTIRDWEDR